MAFWNKKKKKEVPEELPDLISDEIEKASGEVHNFLKEEEKKSEDSGKKEVEVKKEEVKKEVKVEDKKQNFVEPTVAGERVPNPVPKSSKEIVSRLINNISKTEDRPEGEQKVAPTDEKSFFEDLQKNLDDELGDLSKLEEWYEKKFLPRDILSDMRGYWDKKKADAILDKVGKNFQEKIAVKISKLQDLEKLWQSTYFELIEREEEIKNEEAELKEILKEFVKVCKTKRKSLDDQNTGEEKNESSKEEGKK